MKLLDLFSGGGGAAKGYQRAGFYVVGVDNRPMPRYCGDEFVQGGALEYLKSHGHEFDVIHASPPCQAYSRATGKHRWKHQDRIDQVRELLRKFEKKAAYVIENVEGAPLFSPIRLCGSMFGLKVRRHRLFECSFYCLAPECRHDLEDGKYSSLCWKNRKRGKTSPVVGVYGNINYAGEFPLRCEAMGIDWMNNQELTQAIPPAYCEFIGRQLMAKLRQRGTQGVTNGVFPKCE